MSSSQSPDSEAPTGGSLWPRLSIAEWAVFCVLAAVIAAVNIYSTLLVGWGDTGSIIAVLASVLFLGMMGRRSDIQALNLGQTLVSAGGSVGFAVANYAAVKLVDPDFDPHPVLLGLMFVGMGFLGTIVGASVRKYMVRYYFPSGTACAVIQKTVSQQDGSKEGRRPVRLLAVWGGLAALITIPTKVTFSKILVVAQCVKSKGTECFAPNHAIIKDLEFATAKGTTLGLAVDPLLYGIGIVVGPRIGIGMLIGGAAPILVTALLESSAVPPEQGGLWVRWLAIAVLTLPTFASILFAYLFSTPAVIPSGFKPGSVEHAIPKSRNILFAAMGIIGLLITAVCGQILFDLPFFVVVATVAISWPLCVINGRVTGDTDINPVRLVAIVLLSLFAVVLAKFATGSNLAVLLLGVAIIGGTLASMAVDMMQDYRTGFLVNGNPTHQTSVQFVGTLFGALAAVPFFLLVESAMGFGPDTALKAPGAQVWAQIASSFSGGSEVPGGIWLMVIAASIGFSALAFFTVWPKSSAYVPSIFGIGIGLLLGFPACAAICAGGLIKWFVSQMYKRGKEAAAAIEAAKEANNDTMLIGASIFAASAVISILALGLTELLIKVFGVNFVFLAGGH